MGHNSNWKDAWKTRAGQREKKRSRTKEAGSREKQVRSVMHTKGSIILTDTSRPTYPVSVEAISVNTSDTIVQNHLSRCQCRNKSNKNQNWNWKLICGSSLITSKSKKNHVVYLDENWFQDRRSNRWNTKRIWPMAEVRTYHNYVIETWKLIYFGKLAKNRELQANEDVY